MKKRDFYFLGLLLCLIIYAVYHRGNITKNTNFDRNELKKNSINDIQSFPSGATLSISEKPA